jgi:XTP/dITP diphosphohydrolase
MRRIVFATGNEDKMREVREIMKDTGFEVVSMREAGIKTDAVENGSSFTENAVIKARAVASLIDDYVMADDSGLVIDALGGEPGIYSARYMGTETSYRVKNRNLIERLRDTQEIRRTARFVCAIALVEPDGDVYNFEGSIDGRIGYAEAGRGGFGYDPIFFISYDDALNALISGGLSEKEAIPEADNMAAEAMRIHAVTPVMNGWISTAQLPEKAKNAVSHRGRALLTARAQLGGLL